MYGLIVSDFDVSETVGVVLFVLGIGFLIANLHIFWQFFCYRRLRSSALVTWPREKPPFYGWLLAFGVVAGVLVFIKLIVQQRPPIQALGEGMMLVYYAYALPLKQRIGQGLYASGIWCNSGFVAYGTIGGLSWREDSGITLMIINRVRTRASLLAVPQIHYGEVRRLLRDKIATHDIPFSGKTFDLGTDEREFI